MTTLKKTWNIVSTALVVLIVLCAVFLMGSRLLGFQCYNVISPSMEPEYLVGDLIYVKEVDPATIKEGDVITFIVNEDLVVGTHRVVRVDAENQRFYTKGDANEIGRTTGAERRHWIRQKRRLWLSLIPFVKYRCVFEHFTSPSHRSPMGGNQRIQTQRCVF